MQKYSVILFDLDGTLTDPKEGITKSVHYALKKMGIEVKNSEELTPFIGPPLQESFKTYYDMNDQQVQEALHYYRERFKEKGMFENEVYTGIAELLTALSAQGLKLAVATSKPTVFAEAILHHFNLHHFFNCIVGSELDGTRTAKAEVILEVMKQLHLSSADGCVMIGDRSHDIIGANENNMDSIGVTFGYGSRNELEQVGATYLVENVASIEKHII